MKNILKQFEVSATASKQSNFGYATIRLTAYYVVSISLILAFSSLLVITLFSIQPDLPQVAVPEPEHSEFSRYEFREHLTSVLFITDVIVLVVVGILAFFFARKTLSPIKTVYELQTKFVSDVAHELRTPLAVMKAGTETILRKDRTAEEYRSFIKDEHDEIDRLTRLSNQLLFLLSEDTKHSPTSEVNITNLLIRQTERYRTYADSQGVTLEVISAPEVSLTTHEDLLIQLIQNLIKNAIDYNQKGGLVRVSLTVKKSSLDIVISDTGIGISEADQSRIFDRFYKANQARTSGTHTGSGLGLSIVKRIVDTLGGTISVNSSLGHGSIFTVPLPRH